MRIAVFGAAGQVGRALQRVGARRGATILPFDRATADITNGDAVAAALHEVRPAAVINAAAYTAVDKAESEPDRATLVNRDGAANVARAARASGIQLLHLSTDYVFDGTKAGSYVEDDAIAPLGTYGRSKAEGEAAVQVEAPDAVIARTAWVYGLEGANFVKTMLRLGADRDVLRVVNDQRGCPTFADDLAEALLSIAEKCAPRAAGTYHLAAAGQTTWFDFARKIFAEAARFGRPVPRVESITTNEYPTPARRPANSVLDCTKAKRVFGVELAPWDDGLSRMLNAHLAGPHQ
jgi:dTDP-4-dehydrorhamnose reductase